MLEGPQNLPPGSLGVHARDEEGGLSREGLLQTLSGGGLCISHHWEPHTPIAGSPYLCLEPPHILWAEVLPQAIPRLYGIGIIDAKAITNPLEFG